MAIKQFTTDTTADPIVMNELVNEVNINTSAIGQIATDRGYKSSKRITTQLELDNTLNGKYYVEPIGELSAGWLDVTTRHELESQYQIQTFYQANGKSIIRYCWGGAWGDWKEIAMTDKFTATSQSLVIGAGFEAQTGASPFQVTKSGTILHFIGQVKCITANVAQPVVLAISPVKPLTYYGLNVTINGTLSNTLTIDPTTGNLYVYRNFVIGDIINFNGFAMGVL